MRQTNWWLESKQFGRLTIGQITGAADGTETVDLGDLGAVTQAETYETVGNLLLFNKTTGRYCGQVGSSCSSTLTWVGGTTGATEPQRHDGIKYETPTWNGFQFAASWGENDAWAVALKFANERNGLRVAAAAGYIQDLDEQAVSSFVPNGGQGGVLPIPNQVSNVTAGNHDARRFQTSASIWHVPSGVFLSASYFKETFHGSLDADLTRALGSRPDMQYFWMAGGLRKNWFGVGTTALYAEYGHGDDILTGTGFDAANGTRRIADNSNWLWGVGVVQNVDVIATEFFLGYRHHSVDIVTEDVNTGANRRKENMETIDTVFAGARIKF